MIKTTLIEHRYNEWQLEHIPLRYWPTTMQVRVDFNGNTYQAILNICKETISCGVMGRIETDTCYMPRLKILITPEHPISVEPNTYTLWVTKEDMAVAEDNYTKPVEPPAPGSYLHYLINLKI